MSLDQICSKKDKRLLVLLAFGSIVIFSDINLFDPQTPVPDPQTWIELQGREKVLYRSKSEGALADTVNVMSMFEATGVSDHEYISDLKKLMHTKGTLSINKNLEKQYTISSVSPRLSFFLGQPFSINSAEAEELSLVPGIGPSMAKKIINYREENGPLSSAYQMEKIPGVGTRTRIKLQKYFTYSDDSE